MRRKGGKNLPNMENQNLIKKISIRLNFQWECDQKINKILERAAQSKKYRSQNDFIKAVLLSYGEKEWNKTESFCTEETKIQLKEPEKKKTSESAINPLLI